MGLPDGIRQLLRSIRGPNFPNPPWLQPYCVLHHSNRDRTNMGAKVVPACQNESPEVA